MRQFNADLSIEAGNNIDFFGAFTDPATTGELNVTRTFSIDLQGHIPQATADFADQLVPEPGTLGLIGIGLLGIFFAKNRACASISTAGLKGVNGM